jgi:hypothetical protein
MLGARSPFEAIGRCVEVRRVGAPGRLPAARAMAVGKAQEGRPDLVRHGAAKTATTKELFVHGSPYNASRPLSVPSLLRGDQQNWSLIQSRCTSEGCARKLRWRTHAVRSGWIAEGFEREHGVPPSRVWNRVARGRTIEPAIETPRKALYRGATGLQENAAVRDAFSQGYCCSARGLYRGRARSRAAFVEG